MNRYAGFKLLIVDDNEKNLYALRSLVEKYMDVEILEASSGQGALDKALRPVCRSGYRGSRRRLRIDLPPQAYSGAISM